MVRFDHSLGTCRKKNMAVESSQVTPRHVIKSTQVNSHARRTCRKKNMAVESRHGSRMKAQAWGRRRVEANPERSSARTERSRLSTNCWVVSPKNSSKTVCVGRSCASTKGSKRQEEVR
jgi:hypothetical protein